MIALRAATSLDQASLAAAVLAANSASIAVLVHGNPTALDSLAFSYPAIVETFEGGQSAGTALASMLLGQSRRAPSPFPTVSCFCARAYSVGLTLL